MAVRLNTIRMMVGSQWTPLEVQFAHEGPADILEHQRIFGAPVLFGYPTNNIVVEHEFLERQVPAADTRLFGIMKHYLERVLEEMPQEDGALASMRRAIAESLRDGEPSLVRVAKKLAMSPRTLQRQLKEYGVQFKNRQRHAPAIRPDLPQRPQKLAYGNRISFRLRRSESF